MEKTAYVTNEEITQAEENWYDAHYGLHCEEVMERFFTYCHSLEQSRIDDPLDGTLEKYHVAEDTARRVKLLAGPHYRTVVRAYYVKHPWK